MKIREFDALMVDRPTEGVFSLSRDVYLDQELFELELEHIFEKTWLFLGHESQLPNPHDFLTTFMGRHPVVVIRDEAGTLNGFINACAHRGAVLCRTQAATRNFWSVPITAGPTTVAAETWTSRIWTAAAIPIPSPPNPTT